jgi:hypothetical protein
MGANRNFPPLNVRQGGAMPKIIPTDKARQGHRGTHLLLMLIVALVLVFIVWGGVEIYGRLIEPPAAGTVSAISVPAMHAPAG